MGHNYIHYAKIKSKTLLRRQPARGPIRCFPRPETDGSYLVVVVVGDIPHLDCCRIVCDDCDHRIHHSDIPGKKVTMP